MNLTLPVRAEFAFSMASLIVASTEAISALNHFSALWTATRIIKQCFRFGLWISNVQKSSRNVLSRVRHANCNGVHFISLFGLQNKILHFRWKLWSEPLLLFHFFLGGQVECATITRHHNLIKCQDLMKKYVSTNLEKSLPVPSDRLLEAVH